ncbi:MAG: type I glutamate--ammonia ligase [Thermoprotei archaeon]
MAEKSFEEIQRILDEKGVKHVDLWFTDVKGYLKHVTMEASEVDEKFVVQGAAKLDGSSIAGFSEIYESDLVLKADWSTLAPIPWLSATGRVFTDVYRGFAEGRLERDPRFVAQSAELKLRDEGYSSYWGPEPEFFVFESVSFSCDSGQAHYKVSSREAPWSGEARGYVLKPKGGYYPSTPQDTLMEFRSKVAETLVGVFGIQVEAHHHEVATAGQCEVDFRYGGLTKTADSLQTVKYVVKNIAHQMGLVATFMPKPIFGDNGSGMHTHQSLWRGTTNSFYDPKDEYAELSQTGRYYVGGLLEHGRALAAFVSPTTNSYKRLVPGFEAPVYLAWSKRNRSAAVRVPMYHRGIEAAKRVEYRPPDPSTNPYLAFAAMAMAGLDGIKKKLEPGDPVDENIYHLTPHRRQQLGIGELPGSLKEALEELRSDNEFLRPVFSSSLLEAYQDIKAQEWKEESIRPTPFEYYQYFDV